MDNIIDDDDEMVAAPAVRLLGRAGGPQISPADAQAQADVEYRKAQGIDDDSVAVAGAVDPDDFDPFDYNIDDVIAYVLEHPEAREDIADLERDGKNRVTLMAHLDA